MPGGGPQGCAMGGLEYDVNSNDNADFVPLNMRFKFVDDLSFLEKLNLILAGVSSYLFKSHVASDIGTDQLFLPTENLMSQQYLKQVEHWTKENKAKLNVNKSNFMIFNFNNDYQFSTRLYIDDSPLQQIHETKLLGSVITSDLKWHRNTEVIVKKAFKRMIIIHRLKAFKVSQEDLVQIYILYIRSVLEQSCQVWHFSLTEEDSNNIERVQKVACRIILENYTTYEKACESLQIESLKTRRFNLSLNFARQCLKHPFASKMFPRNENIKYNTRHKNPFMVQKTKTSRLLYSAIPQLQRALNMYSK